MAEEKGPRWRKCCRLKLVESKDGIKDFLAGVNSPLESAGEIQQKHEDARNVPWSSFVSSFISRLLSLWNKSASKRCPSWRHPFLGLPQTWGQDPKDSQEV